MEDQKEDESSWNSRSVAKEIGAGMLGGFTAVLGFGFVGLASGAWHGPGENPVVWTITPILGTTIGVCVAGDRESELDRFDQEGSFSASPGTLLATLAGSTLGFGLPFGIAKLSGLELGSASQEIIVPTYISAIICASIGATIAFNLTSSADSDDQPNSALAPMRLNLLNIQF
ncbi:hypothetical protein ACFL6S_35415 [Candidatus Poribacteria bacterium]